MFSIATSVLSLTFRAADGGWRADQQLEPMWQLGVRCDSLFDQPLSECSEQCIGNIVQLVASQVAKKPRTMPELKFAGDLSELVTGSDGSAVPAEAVVDAGGDEIGVAT